MAAAEQFSLRWNNFQSNMTSGFHSLWEGEDLVDVTLAADGRFLQAHKVVLSVCSPYFKTLFKVNPCKHPIVILKDVGYKDLEALLQFMYRGEVNVCQEELPSFLKTAEMLEVKGLTGEESQRDNSPSQPAPTSKLKERVHLSQESSGNVGPPLKRKRTACPVSPIVIGDEPSSRGSHGDYSELTQPKVEPTDVEGEEGEDYSTDKDASDSLATLLGGESSHGGMHGDSIQGMDASMFSNLSSHQVQDSGGSGGPQDGSQVEYIRTEKGHWKALLGGFMYTRHRTYNDAVEWRCDQRKVCSSRVWIRTDNDEVVKFMAHTHPADHARVTRAKLARLGIPTCDLKVIETL